MAKLCRFAVGMLVFGLSLAAWGDSWTNPGSRVFAATSGERGFKVIATRATEGTHAAEKEARGVLFYVEEDGTEKVLWDKKLVNIPMCALVSSSNNCVVTLDTWGRLGYEHALVIYDSKGEVVMDLKLADLLTMEEIEKNVGQSKSSRDWLREADTHFDETAGHLVIALKWGKVITIDLKSGKVV